LAKYRVERDGGEYYFPTLGIVARDGDVIDAPDGLDVAGLVPVSKTSNKPVAASVDAVDGVTPAADAAAQ
jgi:hypothetical protein